MIVTQVQNYPIAETFHSLQGEGAWAGTNAFFIRLAGCDVTFSPKTYKLPKLSIYEKVNELKVVISNTADFSWAEQQALCIPSTALQYLQPEWNYPESQALIVNYILQHPQWRLSLQSHKYLGLR